MKYNLYNWIDRNIRQIVGQFENKIEIKLDRY